MRLFGIPSLLSSVSKPSKLVTSAPASTTDELNDPDQASSSDIEAEIDDLVDIGDGDSASLTPGSRATAASAGSSAPGGDRSADIYLLIHRLQADIHDHQALVDRLTRRELENEAMRSAYEGKISILQAERTAAARERDEALKRMSANPGRGGVPEKAGTLAIKAQFEAKSRKLEAEIAMNKKKLAEAIRANKKTQNDNLTKQLQSTIENLKREWLIFRF